MARIFGPQDENVLHGSTPFDFGQEVGGSPDVVKFSQFTEGVLYVTADLIGSNQVENAAGNYELAVVHQEEEDRA